MTQEERMKAVGLNIWMARKDSEMSQAELAELIPCAQSTLSQIENGNRALSLDMLCVVAGALDYKPGRLLNGVG